MNWMDWTAVDWTVVKRTYAVLAVNLVIGFSGDGSRVADLTGALLLVSSIFIARPRDDHHWDQMTIEAKESCQVVNAYRPAPSGRIS